MDDTSTLKCSGCGSALPNDSTTCTNCGSRFPGGQPASAVGFALVIGILVLLALGVLGVALLIMLTDYFSKLGQ